MVEYTDPNPFKEFHIGHLMSNAIGESIARLFEYSGATVVRANYQGDVGLHVAKGIWGKMQKPSAHWGEAYVYGSEQYDARKQEIDEINKKVYEKSDEKINKLYDDGRTTSLEHFEVLYKALGTKFDKYFFESEVTPLGTTIVKDNPWLFVESDGARVFRGEEEGLHTRVFLTSQGLPTYEAKDLGLAKTKWERWHYDRSYIVTANEIDEYFKFLLKTLSLLYPELAEKTTHLSHGMMKLTSGKMSSRTGKVITGEGLLNELRDVVMKKMGDRNIKDRESVADTVAVGALKYTVLKQAVGGDITYEPEKITNMEGDTGPYLQYTYARTQSVLKKAGKELHHYTITPLDYFNSEEISILKWIYRYPEVVSSACDKYAPHMIAGYTYELGQRFNTFYNQHKIVDNQLRILITEAVALTLKSGLNLLGIVAPEEM